MTFRYYPGCTLKTKARKLDETARRCAAALGAELVEPADWQCCGAVYPMAKDEIAPKLSAVRALADAKAQGQELVTLCAACHNVLKRTNLDMANDEHTRDAANRYLQLPEAYSGETTVLHYLELLRDRIGWDAIRAKVTHPLTGRKIGAYYGCLLLRPAREMQMDDAENPTIIEDFLRAIGAEPVVYAMRNECCGAYVTMEDRAAAKARVEAILQNAQACGCEELTTACPLCLYNLRENGGALKVTYFTELLAQALGLEAAE
ncbi:MAG: disulfide reductase [Oscillospiraceae bacterium]|nr:disulfide reductase [Oscillospiraceae bacterium]